jgi:hypothetical protein
MELKERIVKQFVKLIGGGVLLLWRSSRFRESKRMAAKAELALAERGKKPTVDRLGKAYQKEQVRRKLNHLNFKNIKKQN